MFNELYVVANKKNFLFMFYIRMVQYIPVQIYMINVVKSDLKVIKNS